MARAIVYPLFNNEKVPSRSSIFTFAYEIICKFNLAKNYKEASEVCNQWVDGIERIFEQDYKSVYKKIFELGKQMIEDYENAKKS